jgi:4-diphosphocytidyl-2-C-methyl-D-erythritol kinase
MAWTCSTDIAVTASVVTAPAKLTLSLRITGVRADGFHLLESEMVTLDLADTLTIEGLPEGTSSELAISVDPEGPGGGWDSRTISTGSDNLVVRALDAVDRSANVRLAKRIPPGAGLGGGSADAAAVLRWAGCRDVSIAASLGADVPFCVSGGRAMVRGIGEQVTQLSYEERQFVLLLLPFGVDTAAAYRAWDELAQGSNRPGQTKVPADGEPVVNDLEVAALAVEPRLGPWRDRLAKLAGRRPHLAGSGSTWFVEGSPDDLGIRDRQTLQMGGETGVLVAVTTTKPEPV